MFNAKCKNLVPGPAFAWVNLVPAKAGIYSYSRNHFKIINLNYFRKDFIFLNYLIF